MTACIRPTEDGKIPGFDLDSLWVDRKTLISWLEDAGMEKTKTKRPKKTGRSDKNHKKGGTHGDSVSHKTILTVDAPENVEAALASTIDSLTGNATSSLEYVQQLDDLVFDEHTPFPEDDPSKSKNAPVKVSEVYEDVLGDTASSYFSETRFKILALSCVYVCVRAYSECSITVDEEIPGRKNTHPQDTGDPVGMDEIIRNAVGSMPDAGPDGSDGSATAGPKDEDAVDDKRTDATGKTKSKSSSSGRASKSGKSGSK